MPDREGEDGQHVRGGAVVARDREPAEADAEDVDEHDSERGSRGWCRARRCVVGEGQLGTAAVAAPGQHAHRDAERDGDQRRPPGTPAPPGRAWRAAAARSTSRDRELGDERGAEVAGEEAVEVVRGTAARSGSSSPSDSRLAATRSAGAVGPSAARTGSPGIRWIIRNDAVTSTHSDTSSRPERRTANRAHTWERTPVRGPPTCGPSCGSGAIAELAIVMVTPRSIRMLVGHELAGVLELGAGAEGLHDVVGEGHDVGGGEERRLGVEPGRRSPRCRSWPIASSTPGVVVGVRRCRRSSCRPAPPAPERNGTSWSGLFTLSGTQAMSQSPVPKIVAWQRGLVRALGRRPRRRASFHCWTASSAAAATPLRRRCW